MERQKSSYEIANNMFEKYVDAVNSIEKASQINQDAKKTIKRTKTNIEIESNQQIEKAFNRKRTLDPTSAKISDLLEEIDPSLKVQDPKYVLYSIENEPGAGYQKHNTDSYDIESFRNRKNQLVNADIKEVQSFFDDILNKLNNKYLISFITQSALPMQNNGYSFVANSKHIAKIADCFVNKTKDLTFKELIKGSESIAQKRLQEKKIGITNLEHKNQNKKHNQCCTIF